MPLVSQLQALLGSHAVLTGDADVAPHATDWRGRYRGNASCVALPGSTEQVAAIVRACAEHAVPIVAQGGNTSLCEGADPGQPLEPEHDAPVERDGAPGIAGAAAAGDERNVVLVAPGEDARDLVGARGKDDGVGPAAETAPLGLIAQVRRRPFQNDALARED